jgi:hypothetical protein
LQHAVAMRGPELIKIKELRHRERLLEPDAPTAVLRVAGLFSPNAERVTGGLERHMLGVDARQGDIDPPPVLGRVDLERRGGRIRRAVRQVAPELVEHTVKLTLEIEQILIRRSSEAKHTFLLSICLGRGQGSMGSMRAVASSPLAGEALPVCMIGEGRALSTQGDRVRQHVFHAVSDDVKGRGPRDGAAVNVIERSTRGGHQPRAHPTRNLGAPGRHRYQCGPLTDVRSPRERGVGQPRAAPFPQG